VCRIPPPKSCGLGTKGTKTRLEVNPAERDDGYLPIKHCGGATYNQTNGAGRHAVIHDVTKPEPVGVDVGGGAVCVCVCVGGGGDACICGCGSLAMCVCVCECVCVSGVV